MYHTGKDRMTVMDNEEQEHAMNAPRSLMEDLARRRSLEVQRRASNPVVASAAGLERPSRVRRLLPARGAGAGA